MFQVPTVGVWFKAANVLFNVLVKRITQSGKMLEEIECLHSVLDTDVKFSEARCKKVFPIAVAKYQDSLPSHYTKQYHERKVVSKSKIKLIMYEYLKLFPLTLLNF